MRLRARLALAGLIGACGDRASDGRALPPPPPPPPDAAGPPTLALARIGVPHATRAALVTIGAGGRAAALTAVTRGPRALDLVALDLGGAAPAGEDPIPPGDQVVYADAAERWYGAAYATREGPGETLVASVRPDGAATRTVLAGIGPRAWAPTPDGALLAVRVARGALEVTAGASRLAAPALPAGARLAAIATAGATRWLVATRVDGAATQARLSADGAAWAPAFEVAGEQVARCATATATWLVVGDGTRGTVLALRGDRVAVLGTIPATAVTCAGDAALVRNPDGFTRCAATACAPATVTDAVAIDLGGDGRVVEAHRGESGAITLGTRAADRFTAIAQLRPPAIADLAIVDDSAGIVAVLRTTDGALYRARAPLAP